MSLTCYKRARIHDCDDCEAPPPKSRKFEDETQPQGDEIPHRRLLELYNKHTSPQERVLNAAAASATAARAATAAATTAAASAARAATAAATTAAAARAAAAIDWSDPPCIQEIANDLWPSTSDLPDSEALMVLWSTVLRGLWSVNPKRHSYR